MVKFLRFDIAKTGLAKQKRRDKRQNRNNIGATLLRREDLGVFEIMASIFQKISLLIF
jgi:hypothetical protein